MFGCVGGAVTLGTVAITAALTGARPVWSVLGWAGCLVLAVLALYCWRLVRRDGFFHGTAPDEDEDGNPEGGSGVRFPPDAPDGGGSLEFDWERFLVGFWDYVEASSREAERELALQ